MHTEQPNNKEKNLRIEKIFIPTVLRPDRQYTYSQLAKSSLLKERIVLVVQEWERDQYDYDCEYLVLPPSIYYTDQKAIAKTRNFLYHHAKGMRYSVLDDDLEFRRRNQKYWTGVANFEKSHMVCSTDELEKMFFLFDEWLDEEDVGFCGPGQINNPPLGVPFSKNAAMTSAYFIDGKKVYGTIKENDLVQFTVASDVHFILTLLSNGHQNKVSNEYIIKNFSIIKKDLTSSIWDKRTKDEIAESHIGLNRLFPDHFKLLYDPNDDTRKGGFRDGGKVKIFWNRAYKDWKQKQNTSTDDLSSFYEGDKTSS